MNVLVTGAGSLIGHGILRSLQQIDTSGLTIFTADPDHRAAGHWLGNYGLKIPLANDPLYLQALSSIIEAHQIDVVFVGTDPELYKISSSIDQIHAAVIISDLSVIKIGDDKWATVNFLKENGFAYPDSALLDDENEVNELIRRVGFPLIAKPRVGARSAGVFKIQHMQDLDLLKGRNDYILQEFLPEESGEFTAGTMTYEGVCYSTVIFKRDLKDGNTYRAYSYHNEAHERYLRKVSSLLEGTYGPLNFQYRVKNGVPVIFEINSRFSGTTPLRTAIGVNEIEMALLYVKEGKLSEREPSVKEVAILRTWSDIIVPMKQLTEFHKQSELKNPSANYFPFLK
jgi:carbamoyl-phosphate synthase large subunit